jgi:hypothetical protein
MARALVGRLAETRSRLAEARTRSPFGGLHAVFERGGEGELERRGLVLAARVEHVHRLLSDATVASLDSEVERLRGVRTSTSIVDAVEAYGRAEAIAVAHRDVVRGLERRRAQLVAALEQVVGLAEALPTKLMELDLARIEACDEALGTSVVETPTP